MFERFPVDVKRFLPESNVRWNLIVDRLLGPRPQTSLFDPLVGLRVAATQVVTNTVFSTNGSLLVTLQP